jgi:hypothetical protein
MQQGQWDRTATGSRRIFADWIGYCNGNSNRKLLLPRISVIGSDTATETAAALSRISRINGRIQQRQRLLGGTATALLLLFPKSSCS